MNENLDRFAEHGFVVLREVIPTAVLSEVRAELEAMVDDIARGLQAMDYIQDLRQDEPFETRLQSLFHSIPDLSPKSLRKNLHRKGIYGLLFCPAVLDVAELILGPEIRLYPNYTARPKFTEDAKTLVLWHQDAGYTDRGVKAQDQGLAVSDLRMVNVWTPLVAARPENGCMQFIPGTHKLGVMPHEKREHYLEIAERELGPRLKDAVDVIADPGDVVLFNNLLFHQGQANTSGKIRWSFDFRYQDARQPTLRPEKGHLARSQADPGAVVSTAEQWANASFG